VFDSRRYKISWEVVGLERGPLSFENTTDELLGRKSIGSVQEIEITAVGIHYVDHATLIYLQNLALISPKSGRRSVGIVRSRTHAAELLQTQNQSSPIERPDCLSRSCRKFVHYVKDTNRGWRIQYNPYNVGMPISLRHFLFHLRMICSTIKGIFLGWYEEVWTTKSYVFAAQGRIYGVKTVFESHSFFFIKPKDLLAYRRFGRAYFWLLLSCTIYSTLFKIKTVLCSEQSVNLCNITRCSNPGDSTIHNHSQGNFK
jgi:hypothetical protein